MIQLARDVVDHLHSAMQARKVYGQDHSASGEQLRQAVAALRSFGRSEGPLEHRQAELRLVCIAGRLYWNDQSVSTMGQHAPIAVAMEKSHLAWLSIACDTSEDELAAFLHACADSGDLAPVLASKRGIHGGAAIAASALSAAAPPSTTELVSTLAIGSLCGDIQSGLELANQSPAEATSRLVALVDRIAAVVASARTAMLPLASLKSHDEYTYVHTVNVGIMSAALAEVVGLRADQVHDIMLGAILHDIGKQLVPTEVLNKGGRLTEAEVEIVRRHPVDGARVLLDVGDLPDIVPIVAFEHHMHIDGGGYPRMGRGWACNLAGQIVHVADVFDAMRTNRPYRAALSTAEACNVMYQGAGTEFDRALLDAFYEHVVVRSKRDVENTVSAAA